MVNFQYSLMFEYFSKYSIIFGIIQLCSYENLHALSWTYRKFSICFKISKISIWRMQRRNRVSLLRLLRIISSYSCVTLLPFYILYMIRIAFIYRTSDSHIITYCFHTFWMCTIYEICHLRRMSFGQIYICLTFQKNWPPLFTHHFTI